MDTLTFIEELVGLLAWPVAVVAVVWAARGPLLALAARHRPPPMAPSGTGEEAASDDDAHAPAAKQDGSPHPDGDARADQAALIGASLTVVLTQFFQAGSWGWWSTGIGLTLLLVVLGYFRISRDPRLRWPRRVVRLLGFAAVIGLCSTVAFAYGVQSMQDDSETPPDTNGRKVKDFCHNLGVGAGAQAVDEANKGLSEDRRTVVLDDVRKAAETKARDDCLGQYGSTGLGVVGLAAAAAAFLIGMLAWWPRKPPSCSA